MKLLDWFLPLKKSPGDDGAYTQLRPKPLLSTINKLEHRIFERFPESGLGRVCHDFKIQAEQAEALIKRLDAPIWPVRAVVWVAISLAILAVFQGLRLLLQSFSATDLTLSDFLQASESAINECIFLAIALFFLTSIETRLKRRVALRALHRLRSLAHVVDMHQLTKTPKIGASATMQETESSPKRPMSNFELSRYLDYCSEILALIAKTAVLFVQNEDDPVILEAVNDLESLTQGLSGKIWQKIMILDLTTDG